MRIPVAVIIGKWWIGVSGHIAVTARIVHIPVNHQADQDKLPTRIAYK